MSAYRAGARRAAVAALVVAAPLLAGCGISDQPAAVHIDFDEFAVISSVPEITTPGPHETAATTVPDDVEPPELAEFPLYFATGTGLTAVSVELPADPSLLEVADALVAGPPADATGGQRSLVQAGLVRSLTLRDNRLTIDLAGSVFERVDSLEQRQLIGQLVLTFAGHPGIDGITQWLFTIDQRPLRVIRRDGTLSQPGVPVGRDDYDVLVDADGQRPSAAVGTSG